jgi:chitodextrinase
MSMTRAPGRIPYIAIVVSVRTLLSLLLALIMVCLIHGASAHAAVITYVQGSYATPQTPQSAVSVSFSAAQTAGNLNVVVVGWNDSTTRVQSVVDTQGNAYGLAVGPTVQVGIATQSVYYAKNIKTAAANGNAVTVRFTAAARYPDIRIAEYGGLDPTAPLDGSGGAQGSGTLSDSGPVATTNGTDLIVGANLVQTGTPGPGSGFARRLLTTPDGDILQDRIVAVPGSYNATAPLSSGGSWIMQVVAFRAASGPTGDTTPPTAPSALTVTVASATQLTLTWTAATDNVAVAGYRLERCQGVGCTAFTQTAAPTGLTYADPGLTPTTSYSYRVRAVDAAGNLSGYSPVGTGTTPGIVSARAISFVQQVAMRAGTGISTASQTFPAPSTTGDLIVVSLKWGDQAVAVASVTDNKGNPYTSAVGPTTWSGTAKRAQTFYARNITGGSTPITITVTLTSNATSSFYVYQLEYAGADPAAPLDGAVAAIGTGTALASGSVTTTGANDLLYGFAVADTGTVSPGAGFRAESTFQGNLAEDATLATSGTASASASNGVSANWFLQLVAFRPAGGGTSGGDITPPTVPTTLTATAASATQINLSWTAATDNVGVTGYRVERCQGVGCTAFTQTAAPTGSSYVDTGLTAATSSSYRVRAVDAAGNLGGYSTVASRITAGAASPTVSIVSPTAGATVSGTVTITATAVDPGSPVVSVQFQVDGQNSGTPISATPYALGLDTTTLANGPHTLAAVARDQIGNQGTSPAVGIVVANQSAGTGALGPLVRSAANSHYFVDPTGKAVLLAGSHTWDDFQDTDTSPSPAPFDFSIYVRFLSAHGHNVTILWRKDLPTYCNWEGGQTWSMAPFPWARTGGITATDGKLAFDLTQFDPAYFSRLRARALQLQQAGIYAIVQLFDGLGLTANRCAIDGYPFTQGNNVNGVDDGYTGGASGVASMTMTSANGISRYQDAYVMQVIDTLNDVPNVLWEISEEAPTGSAAWWAPHMIGLMHAYELGGTFEGITYPGKPYQHPVGYPTTQTPGNDTAIFGSAADWVAPMLSGGNPLPVASPTNQGKVVLNDSDHSYYYPNFLDASGTIQAQSVRQYVWENITNGAMVLFMDPYDIYWTANNRNLCSSPSSGVCGDPDPKYDPLRDNLGYAVSYGTRMTLVRMTPQPTLASTRFCLANPSPTGAQFLVYAPSGGQFTVNLSGVLSSGTLNVEWLDPATGTRHVGAPVSGGSSALSFTPPFSGDAVLYLW